MTAALEALDAEILEICRRNDLKKGMLWAYLFDRGIVGVNGFTSSAAAWEKSMVRVSTF